MQEVQTDEVNASTGNLPRSGVATSNFWIKRGIRQSLAVMTTGDVLIGQINKTGSVDKTTRINARNLIINGSIIGAGLPKEFLGGETDALEERAQAKIRNILDQSQIEIQGTFASHEVLGRHISAERILISSRCSSSSLVAGKDIRIDVNLVGGVATFGGSLQAMGDLGNARGGQTRIRIGGESRGDAKQERLDHTINELQSELEETTNKLTAHTEEMDKKGKKSTYWKSLMEGEKKVPKGPTERAVLMAFAKDLKERADLERAVADGTREIEDMTQ